MKQLLIARMSFEYIFDEKEYNEINEYIYFCYRMNVMQDSSVADELSTDQVFQLRKMVESELMPSKSCQVEKEDFELWQDINNKMLPNARELCEQLRLILEPTKCTRLKGDYRTGRRINMKKVSFQRKSNRFASI